MQFIEFLQEVRRIQAEHHREKYRTFQQWGNARKAALAKLINQLTLNQLIKFSEEKLEPHIAEERLRFQIKTLVAKRKEALERQVLE